MRRLVFLDLTIDQIIEQFTKRQQRRLKSSIGVAARNGSNSICLPDTNAVLERRKRRNQWAVIGTPREVENFRNRLAA